MAYMLLVAAAFALEAGQLPDPAQVGAAITQALLGGGDHTNWAVVSFDAAYPPKPAPPPPDTPRWRVRVNAAFLRGGPGVTYPTLGAVHAGEVLAEIGHEAGWVRSERGWVFGNLLERVT